LRDLPTDRHRFIDMDEKRNNRTVERRLKESLKHDAPHPGRSHLAFGLLEMSRQRIRTSVLESSTENARNAAARPRPLGLVGGAAIAAFDRGNAAQGCDA